MVKKQEEIHRLMLMLDGGDVEVFVDGDVKNSFIVGGRFAGVEEFNGRKYFVFQIREGIYKDRTVKRIIDSARITGFSISK